MDIEIPDLDDIKFSRGCRCCAWSNDPPNKECVRCKGSGIAITGAGEELLRFLKEQGLK